MLRVSYFPKFLLKFRSPVLVPPTSLLLETFENAAHTSCIGPQTKVETTDVPRLPLMWGTGEESVLLLCLGGDLSVTESLSASCPDFFLLHGCISHANLLFLMNMRTGESSGSSHSTLISLFGSK